MANGWCLGGWGGSRWSCARLANKKMRAPHKPAEYYANNKFTFKLKIINKVFVCFGRELPSTGAMQDILWFLWKLYTIQIFSWMSPFVNVFTANAFFLHVQSTVTLNLVFFLCLNAYPAGQYEAGWAPHLAVLVSLRDIRNILLALGASASTIALTSRQIVH